MSRDTCKDKVNKLLSQYSYADVLDAIGENLRVYMGEMNDDHPCWPLMTAIGSATTEAINLDFNAVMEYR